MKRISKKLALVIGAIAILGMGYNLWAFTQLKKLLVPTQPILPPIVDTYTIGILFAILLTCIFHLILLFHTFFFLPRITKHHFWGALFFCSLVLSGLYIASDAALLHDLGRGISSLGCQYGMDNAIHHCDFTINFNVIGIHPTPIK